MNGILAAAGIEPQLKSTRSRRLMAAAPAKGSELRSAGACADEHVASRASRHGEAGDHLARQPLRFRDDLLVVRPFADQRVAIESVLQQPQPVRGAAQLGMSAPAAAPAAAFSS